MTITLEFYCPACGQLDQVDVSDVSVSPDGVFVVECPNPNCKQVWRVVFKFEARE